MAPTLFYNLDNHNLDEFQFDVNDVEAANPHRGDMRQLDGIVWMDPEMTGAIGVKYVKENEFWVPGHIPGRPIFPGVLMIEAAAQLASFVMKHRFPEIGFIGFSGVDEVKFRGQVGPGDTLYLLAREVKFRPRRFVCEVQGVVNDSLAFQSKVSGIPI